MILIKLSNDLISNFVKITNDKRVANKETTLYGIVQERTNDSDPIFVKFDNDSNVLTPVESTVYFDKKGGDIVPVQIKDHTATILSGSTSNPIVRLPDVSDMGKTATNFLSMSAADGVIIGNLTSSTLGGNIQLKAEDAGASISLRDGTTILTKFSATSIPFSGITSATTSTSNDTDSTEDDTGTTTETIIGASQTILVNERKSIVKFESLNPIYFSKGIRTDSILVGNDSFITNVDMTLNGRIFDADGKSVFEPITGDGNLSIGYGRFKAATTSSTDWTILYGNKAKISTKNGIVMTQNGSVVFESMNSNGNMVLGYHLYKKGSGNTNIYGPTINLMAKTSITANVGMETHQIVPETNADYALGASASKGWSNIYLGNASGVYNGLRMIVNGANENLCGRDDNGRYIFGNIGSVMYYRAKNVDAGNTGDAFRFTSGNEDADYNSISTWLFGRADSTSRFIGSYLAYNRTYSSAANMVVTANGIFGRSTSSSQRYKRDIELATIDELKGLYDLPIKKYKFNNDYICCDDELYDKYMYGIIVEDLETILPCAVQHITDEEGNAAPEMWNSNIIVPALLKLIQDLNDRVKTLEGK